VNDGYFLGISSILVKRKILLAFTFSLIVLQIVFSNPVYASPTNILTYGEVVSALSTATDAVVTAEKNNIQTDLDAAQALVKALPDGIDQDALQARIGLVQTAIDTATIIQQNVLDGWDIDVRDEVSFPNGEKYVIAGAAKRVIRLDDNFEIITDAKVYAIRWDSLQNKWTIAWQSTDFIADGYPKYDLFQAIRVISGENNRLAMIELFPGGNSGANSFLGLLLSPNGNIVEQPMYYAGRMELSNDNLIRINEYHDAIELSITNDQAIGKKIPWSEMSVGLPDVTNLYFTYNNNIVTPSSSSQLDLKVGSTIALIPQDSFTKQSFDSNILNVYGGIYGGIGHPTACNACLMRYGNSFTFNEPGIYEFAIVTNSTSSGDLTPTFSINVTN